MILGVPIAAPGDFPKRRGLGAHNALPATAEALIARLDRPVVTDDEQRLVRLVRRLVKAELRRFEERLLAELPEAVRLLVAEALAEGGAR
jgi:hypothetical protein